MLPENKINYITIKDSDKLIVIHYSKNKKNIFNSEEFKEIKNRDFCKPFGGLWTSPVCSEYGWMDWCIDNDFKKCINEYNFKLKFKENSKIIVIDNLDNLKSLPFVEGEKLFNLFIFYLDFEYLSKHFDAIWLTANGEKETRLTEPINLYGWDCKSILILNKDCCYQIKENSLSRIQKIFTRFKIKHIDLTNN